MIYSMIVGYAVIALSIAVSVWAFIESWISMRESGVRADEALRNLKKSSAELEVSLANSNRSLQATWTPTRPGLTLPALPAEMMMCNECYIVGVVGKLHHDEDCPNNKSGWYHRE